MFAMHRVLVVVVAAACGASTRPTIQNTPGLCDEAGSGSCAAKPAAPVEDRRGRCARAALNFASLVYWKRANDEIAATPVGEREAARERLTAAFDEDVARGLERVVNECVAANNEPQITCMIAAKTAEDALTCAAIQPP
jgi:hypothetical protein